MLRLRVITYHLTLLTNNIKSQLQVYELANLRILVANLRVVNAGLYFSICDVWGFSFAVSLSLVVSFASVCLALSFVSYGVSAAKE